MCMLVSETENIQKKNKGDIFEAFGTLHTTSQNPFEFELFAFLLQQLRAQLELQIIKEDG